MYTSKKLHFRVLAAWLALFITFFPVSPSSFAGDATQTKQVTSAASVASVGVPPFVNLPLTDPKFSLPAQAPSTSTEFLTQNPISVSEGSGSKGPTADPLPNDPYLKSKGSWKQKPAYDDLWGLKLINAPKAWRLSQGEKVTVAVVDTGVDSTHAELQGRMWVNPGEVAGDGIDNDNNGLPDDVSGWDFNGHTNNTLDDNGHGTHVAGIIAANVNNRIGIAGVAPLATILPVKVLNKYGDGDFTPIFRGIRYAADMGAQIINLSLGAYKKLMDEKFRTAFVDIVNYARQKGSILVVAAGNDNWRIDDFYPAAIAGVITVGALKFPMTRATFSNKGPEIDFTAPGEGILSLKSSQGWKDFGKAVGKDLTVLDGTSMAAPYIAGMIALLISKFPGITYDQIYEPLKVSASRKTFTTDSGWGFPDAYKALTATIKKFSGLPGAGFIGSAVASMAAQGNFFTTPQAPSFSSLSSSQSLYGPGNTGEFGPRINWIAPSASSKIQSFIDQIRIAIKQVPSIQFKPLGTAVVGVNLPPKPAVMNGSVGGVQKSDLTNPPPGTKTKLPNFLALAGIAPGKYQIPKAKWSEPLSDGIVSPDHALFQAMLQAVGGQGRIKQVNLTRIPELATPKFWGGNIKVEMEDGYVLNYGALREAQCLYKVYIGRTEHVQMRCVEGTKDVPPIVEETNQYVYRLFSVIPPPSTPPSVPHDPPGAWGTGESLHGCSINTKFWRDTIEDCPSIMKTSGTVLVTIPTARYGASQFTRLDDFLKTIHDETGLNPQWVSIPPGSHGRANDIRIFIRFNASEGSNEAVAKKMNDALIKIPKLSDIKAFAEWLPEKAK